MEKCFPANRFQLFCCEEPDERIAMSDKLKHGLEELKNELNLLDSNDPKVKKLVSDVDEALNQTTEAAHALADSLQHVAEEFEVNHPQLTAIINNVMTSLSNIGI
jgi:DNA repair ATPase RecN